MNNQNRKPLIGLIALTAALAMPLALAQETTDSSAAAQTQTTDPQTQDATDATSTDATGASTSGSATGAATQSAQESGASGNVRGGKNDWASLDVDADSMISKEESAANPGLSQIFDKADADADGKLTADEYNSFVSKNYGEPQK
ncbi:MULTISPECIES: EF-hand domain-containing protein [unclassified Pseudoxanthomonas]|jgi:hypothetical protein|uniref:EF-hand domain-containing protein n=1 Tax=unclassified Pseudoxanthomonas TaxID=2645906 RepID=UPI003076E568